MGPHPQACILSQRMKILRKRFGDIHGDIEGQMCTKRVQSSKSLGNVPGTRSRFLSPWTPRDIPGTSKGHSRIETTISLFSKHIQQGTCPRTDWTRTWEETGDKTPSLEGLSLCPRSPRSGVPSPSLESCVVSNPHTNRGHEGGQHPAGGHAVGGVRSGRAEGAAQEPAGPGRFPVPRAAARVLRDPDMHTRKEDSMREVPKARWDGCYDDSWRDLIVPAAFAH